MKTAISLRSWPALAGGFLAAGSAVALLARDAFTTGPSVETFLMPVAVALTVLAALMRGVAWHSGNRVAAVIFALIAVYGSAWTIWETMGRRAELRDTAVVAVVDVESQRTRLTKQLAEAEEILGKHRAAAAAECATGEGRLCTGKKATVAVWDAAVVGYQTRLKALPAPKPVDAKADRPAALLELAGFKKEAVKTVVGLIDPAFLPMLLEFSAIAFFGFAFGHKRKDDVAAAAEKPKVEVPAALTPDQVEVVKALKAAKGPVTNNELASLLGCTKGEASKRVAASGGLISKVRQGREVHISLAAA